MLNRGVTLREIASQAKVSVATVSYVLSGKGRMTPETRRDIAHRLREAGIKPKYKQPAVYFLVDQHFINEPSDTLDFFQAYTGMYASFQEAELTLRIEFIDTRQRERTHRELAHLLDTCPGAIVLDSHLGAKIEAIGRYFEKNRIPVVQTGHTSHASTLDAVVVDGFAGAYKAVQHFLKHGHTRIATIRWNVKADPASNKKYAGYTCALAEAGLPVRPEYVVESPFTRRDTVFPGRAAVEKLLALPQPPTAVFVENSFVTPDLIHPSLPGETAVPKKFQSLDMIHFEAWHLEWVEKALAGKLAHTARKTKLLRIDWHELGRMTANRLLARLSGASKTPELLQLVPKLFAVEGMQYTPLETLG